MSQDPIKVKIVDSKIKLELIFSIVAIVISMFAAGSAIFHGCQTRQHLKLSVRPKLVYHTETHIDLKQPGIFLENSGLGPAKIIYMKVFLDNKEEKDFGNLIKKLNSGGKTIWGENKPQWTGLSAETFIKEGKKIPLFCINKHFLY
jgi:hypothetical protein